MEKKTKGQELIALLISWRENIPYKTALAKIGVVSDNWNKLADMMMQDFNTNVKKQPSPERN